MAKEERPKGKLGMQAMMEVYKKLATPGEPHKLLAKLAGSRTTKTRGRMDLDGPPNGRFKQL